MRRRWLLRQCPWPIHICTNTHIKVYNLRLLYFYVYVYVFRCVYGYGYVLFVYYMLAVLCIIPNLLFFFDGILYSAHTLLIYCADRVRTRSVIGTYIGVERFLIVSVEYGIRNFFYIFCI